MKPDILLSNKKHKTQQYKHIDWTRLKKKIENINIENISIENINIVTRNSVQ